VGIEIYPVLNVSFEWILTLLATPAKVSYVVVGRVQSYFFNVGFEIFLNIYLNSSLENQLNGPVQSLGDLQRSFLTPKITAKGDIQRYPTN